MDYKIEFLVKDKTHQLIHEQVWAPINNTAKQKISQKINRKILNVMGGQHASLFMARIEGKPQMIIWTQIKDDLWTPLRNTIN